MDLIKFLTSIRQFEDLTKEEIEHIAQSAETVEYKKGAEIKRRGEIGRFLWIVYDGKVDIVLNDDEGNRRPIASLARGEIFGEMSILTGEPSDVDVTATDKSTLVRIPREEVSAIFAKNPKTLSKFAQTITKRLVRRQTETAWDEVRERAIKVNNDPYDLDFSSAVDPIKILVVNSRSTSLKYTLFNTAYSVPLVDGHIEKIGSEDSSHVIHSPLGGMEQRQYLQDIPAALKSMIDAISDPKKGYIKDIEDIKAVGHRVVHGGNIFYNSVVINEDVITCIRGFGILAPLHNPYNLAGIEAMIKLIPSAVHVAVFDTAFHRNMPEHAYRYALSKRLNEDDAIRRYGFHGTNHNFVMLKAAEFLKRPVKELKIISCHLGHGSSVCAIDHGRSIDTSMGMTPLEGLIMGTRSGDIDPGVLIYLMQLGYLPEELNRILNNESGLKGLSGVSAYMTDILTAAEQGNAMAENAIRMFCYRVKKYIGAYIAALGGLDVLVFTGGIGAGSYEIRARVCQGLEGFGITPDSELNKMNRPLTMQVEDVSDEKSRVKILIIQPDEKKMIARETLHAMGRFQSSKSRTEDYKNMPIPINVSAHHVHLTPAAFEQLFGPGMTLTPRAPLSQPGQFAAEETVNLLGPKGRVDKVRILGPFRKDCQVEISRTEEFKLGIDAPVRDSGDIEGTPGITLEGTGGRLLKMEKGVICARRHIHMSTEDALRFGLRDKDVVLVKIKSNRELIFGDVLIRVNHDFRLDMHIDTDEGNAVQHSVGMTGYIEGIQARAFM
ncbi:acetate/propionate family kinase [Candidatus Magnetominusculus dajiuhuensis]|uniref:acetate/propionate family kinase n=1 Tax=Candidatus Magnetominusculus dajiuhuensis TaxID=3137712 RepID=UPI003B434B51